LPWDASTQETEEVRKDCHFDLGAEDQSEKEAGKADPGCVVKVRKRSVMQGRPPHGEGSERVEWRGLGRVL
jgi:hypothetical protein